MIQKLKEKINFKINSIQFVKREGLTFLDIEIPETSLDQIEEKYGMNVDGITEKIIKFIGDKWWGKKRVMMSYC